MCRHADKQRKDNRRQKPTFDGLKQRKIRHDVRKQAESDYLDEVDVNQYDIQRFKLG